MSIKTCNSEKKRHFRIEVKGWRKPSLYLVFLLLTSLTVLNLGLIIWIIQSLSISSDHLGSNFNIIKHGIELSGKNWIMDVLRTTLIKSKTEENPIRIESSKNFTLRTTNSENNDVNELFLGNNNLAIVSDNLKILTHDELILFGVDANEITFGGLDSLTIDDSMGGSIFYESIGAHQILSHIGKGVTFESPTKSIGCTGEQDLLIKSMGGEISTKAYNELKLLTKKSITLNATNVMIPYIRRPKGHNSFIVNYSAGIYQICSCENGRLYMILPHLTCNIGSVPTICD